MPLAKSVSTPETKIFHHPHPFELEGGGVLPEIEIAYSTFGSVSPEADNVVWVFHALTANSNPVEWWPGLVGPGHYFDPSNYFIVCANILGSCYGTTGAATNNPATGKKYGIDFPEITVGDMVKVHQILRSHLGLNKIHCGIGGSMGGQQLLEWAIREPELFDHIIPIATNAKHSAWGIAFNAAQRQAIEADQTFGDFTAEAGKKGLESARAIAMLSYRTHQSYNSLQTDNDGRLDAFSADSYQRYQGLKLSRRFDAHSYYILSKAMDSHNVGRLASTPETALALIRSKTLAIAIESDLLFPPEDQQFIAENCLEGEFACIPSLYGHDGFLIETESIATVLHPFLSK